MKRIVSLLFIFVSVFCYADSVQQGCVKTRGRTINGKHVPGQGLPGSIVSIKDRTAIGVKNSNGTFSFPVTDNHFRVDSVKKKDYVLLDADAASKIYTHTADTLFFVMETPEQILQDKLSTERRLRRSLQTKLQARENELDSLLTIQKITQEEYQQSLQKLYAEQSENDKLISDMAERYSTLDYDQMDEFYRQVSYYIEQCDFVKADSLLKTRGNLHAQLEAAKQQGKVIQQEKEQLQKAEKVHQHDIDELAKRCYSYFENFKMQHQNDSAAYYLEQRVQLDPTNTQWLDELADFLQEYLAQYDKALEYYQKALEIRKQVLGESHPHVAGTYNNIGGVYQDQGEYNTALEYYQKALEISLQTNNQNHVVELETVYHNIGIVYAYQGLYDLSLENYKKALDITLKVFGKNHPKVAAIYTSIGSVYSMLQDYRAIAYFKMSFDIYDTLGEDDSPEIATLFNQLGMDLVNQYTTYDFALNCFESSLEILLKIYGKNHPTVALVYNNIGIVYAYQGLYDLSLDYYKKSADIYERYQDTEMLKQIYDAISFIYNEQGDYSNAALYMQKAFEISLPQ